MKDKLTYIRLVFLLLIIILAMGLELNAQVASYLDVKKKENCSGCSKKRVCTNTSLIGLSGKSQDLLN